MSRSPRIALTLSRPDSPERVDSRDYYVAALTAAGADIVELYPGDAMPDDVDGLLIAGGGDIDPTRYGEANAGSHHIEPDRDDLEFASYARATELGVPVLGICRGFQVLNVARGGKLIQDVAGHEGPPDGEHWVNEHQLQPVGGSRLAGATGGGLLTVNSHHHQVVTNDILGDGLLPTMSMGDQVEAFETVDGATWVVGVQWHPERGHEVSADATGIIKAFVEQAANR